MQITIKYLKKIKACEEAVKEFQDNFKLIDSIELLQKMIKAKKLNWSNWLVSRLLNRKDKIRYAVYAAEQVIDNFEKVYPNDDRPRLAIEAAKKVIQKDIKQNRSSAESAWSALSAWSARSVADSARSAARSAAESAWSAARSAARSAAESAWSSAESAARSAAESAWSAWSAAESAAEKMKLNIIKYGIKLLRS